MILKQLYLGSTIMILDEPTSVLTPAEADEVLGLLRGMVAEGRLTVLMISHKFREVMQFADEVTVLRRGKLAGRGRVADLDPDAMARMMVGDEPPRASGTRELRERGSVVLEIAGLAAHDDLGMPAVSGFDLQVHAGEIVGIAGVSGNGQSELVEALSGQRLIKLGQILVHDQDFEPKREHSTGSRFSGCRRSRSKTPLCRPCRSPRTWRFGDSTRRPSRASGSGFCPSRCGRKRATSSAATMSRRLRPKRRFATFRAAMCSVLSWRASCRKTSTC